jgi:hypothetical protein
VPQDDIVFAPRANDGLTVKLAYSASEHHGLLLQIHPEKSNTKASLFGALSEYNGEMRPSLQVLVHEFSGML